MKITIGQVSRAKVPKQVSWRDLPKDVGAEEAVGQASRARGIDGEKYGPNSIHGDFMGVNAIYPLVN